MRTQASPCRWRSQKVSPPPALCQAEGPSPSRHSGGTCPPFFSTAAPRHPQPQASSPHNPG